MRVLFIARCPPYPLHFGDRLILYHLARELKARGLTLELIAYTEDEADREQLAANEAEYGGFFARIQWLRAWRRGWLGTTARAVLPGRRFPRSAETVWSLALWQAAQTRAEQCDIVHLFGGVQVYECWHALAGRPALISPYESYTLYLRRQLAQSQGLAFWKALAASFAARNFESWLYRPFARTVVVSEADRRQLAELDPTLKLAVIANGVDLPPAPAQRPSHETPILLFVGNFAYPPNQDAAQRLARRIFPAIQERYPQAQLHLVGAEPPATLRDLANDAIRVTGYVADLAPHWQQASVFVCPLRFGAGIQNKLLEAFAHGVPAVATPLSVAGIPEAVDGEQLLLAENDAASDEALIEQTLACLEDPAASAKRAAAARNLTAERYSWAGVAAKYHALYGEILTETGG